MRSAIAFSPKRTDRQTTGLIVPTGPRSSSTSSRSGTRTRSSASSSTGACTRCRQRRTSGIRATCIDPDEGAYKNFHEHFANGDDAKGYKDLIPLFRAEHFDATEWAKLFKDSGAQYVVPVAEHHDGFSMYDSGLSRLDRGEDGAEARHAGRTGEGNARRRPALRPQLASRRAQLLLLTAAAPSAPTSTIRSTPRSMALRTSGSKRRGDDARP